MADFIQTAQTKTAVRTLATPLTNLAAFSALVESVIDDNPWGCEDYVQQGITVDGVTQSRSNYSAKIDCTDPGTGKSIGYINVKAQTPSGLVGAKATIIADADLATDLGGILSNDSSDDKFQAALKCKDPNGEFYYVTFNRDSIRVTSYSSDSILAKVETWADTKPALA